MVIDLPVHFVGTVIGPSGFAGEGRQWLWALEAAGFAPSLSGYALGSNTCPLSKAETELIERCASRSQGQGGMTFHHSLIPHFAPDPTAAINVLKTLFETEALPPGWAQSASRANVVLVSTEFNRRTFADAGIAKRQIELLPPPFSAEGFTPRAEARRPGPFRWLSIFDWQQRKGPELLLDAFGKTFTAGEAELTIKVMPDPQFSREQIEAHCIREVRAAAGDDRTAPSVRVLDGSLDGEQVLDLYRDADGFVLPSRGEGWGRPVHEAMLMEVPVVTSAGSALATLLPDTSVGYPVRCEIAPVSEVAAREIETFRGLAWHEPDPLHLCQSMRRLFQNPVEARARAARGRQHLLALCDPARISADLGQLLRRLARPLVSA